MNKLLISLLCITFLLPRAADAAVRERSDRKVDVREPLEEAWHTDNIERLKELGIAMINRRLTSLEKYSNLLTHTKFLLEPTREKLRGELDRVRQGLNDLKAKIQNESDVTKLKEHIKSIISNYRFYEIFLPQLVGIVSVDHLRAYAVKLSEVVTHIDAEVTKLEEDGLEVGAIREMLTTTSNFIEKGKNATNRAEEKFLAMNVREPEKARLLRMAGRETLWNGRASLSKARAKIKSAVQEIKELLSKNERD